MVVPSSLNHRGYMEQVSGLSSSEAARPSAEIADFIKKTMLGWQGKYLSLCCGYVSLTSKSFRKEREDSLKTASRRGHITAYKVGIHSASSFSRLQ